MQPLIQRIYEVMQDNNQLFIDAGLQPIQTIDLYRGQPLNPEAFEIYGIPALFLQWSINWVREGKQKVGNGTLEVHIVTDAPWGTGNIFTGYEAALKQVFGYSLVNEILEGLESEVTSKLSLVNERPVDTGVICYQINSYNFTTYKTAQASNSVEINGAKVEILGKRLVKNLSE